MITLCDEYTYVSNRPFVPNPPLPPVARPPRSPSSGVALGLLEDVVEEGVVPVVIHL